MSLAWPHSPHRGEVAAWFNHVLLLLLLGGMTALLFAALDATGMATRLLARLDPSVAMPRRGKPPGGEVRRRDSGGKDGGEAGVPFPLPGGGAPPGDSVICLPVRS